MSSTGLECVFDLPLQTAARRYTHKKIWNVIVHMVADWTSAWTMLSLGSFFLPFWVQAPLILVYLAVAVMMHPCYGGLYAACYTGLAFHALFVRTDVSLLNIVLLLCLSMGTEIVVGHFIIEKSFERVNIMGEEVIFLIIGLAIDIFYAAFHFTIIFLMRVDLMPDLKSKSDTELRKLMDRMQEMKFSKKAP